jgi:hypothetical protein
MKVSPELEAKILALAGQQAPAPDVDDIDEKAFQAAIVKLAKRNGWKVYHVYYSQKSAGGFPDLVCLRGKRQVVAELKVKNRKPRPDQDEWLEAFRNVGAEVFVWWPRDWDEIERVLA